ncbi:MAG: nucleotide sugar dehydrogenase, partial [candidate division KSB1 bacterium]|nr:nucleotide sugar dehydrogenase [candidate division KSB1 bacterium]
SFINEIANICELVGADVHDVAKGMGLDHRIGSKFLHAGPGYGGSCFPKDTRALLNIGQQHGYHFKIVEATIKVNDQQRRIMLEKIIKAIGEVRGKTIAVLGLAFKPSTDDMREAPSIDIIKGLQKLGARIQAYDPVAIHEAKKIFTDVLFAEDTYAAINGADALVFITEWNQFRSLDLDRVKRLMKKPVIIDLRNIYDPTKMREEGFHYTGVGRL